jgi:Ca2+-binding EF-hand superfamily protein
MSGKRPLSAVGIVIVALSGAGTAWSQPPSRNPAPALVQPAVSQADATFSAWDTDRSGALSRQEFSAGWAAVRRMGEVQARLHEQFRSVDANRNDAIDAGEYGNLLLVQRAGTSAFSLATFDTNKNQQLEFSEYVGLVRRLATPTAAPATKKSP